MNQKDQKSLFEQAMADVTPLKTTPRHIPDIPPPSWQPQPNHDAPTQPHHEWVLPSHLELLGPNDKIAHLNNHIPAKRLKQFKRGQLPKQAELDLHGHTANEAGEALHDFLAASHAQEKQCVHVIHGKGSLTAGAKLKTYVNHWLQNSPYVLAYSSAQPKDGGTGCLYVLLKRPKR